MRKKTFINFYGNAYDNNKMAVKPNLKKYQKPTVKDGNLFDETPDKTAKRFPRDTATTLAMGEEGGGKFEVF